MTMGEPTHEVLNQPPPLEDYSLYETDAALREGHAREAGGAFEAELLAFGRLVGRAETFALGRQANRFAPELRTHDRFGHRIDEVEFHPAWHAVMRLAMEHRVHNLPWAWPEPGTIVARVVLARTSLPPCFSVIAMPISTASFWLAGSRRGS